MNEIQGKEAAEVLEHSQAQIMAQWKQRCDQTLSGMLPQFLEQLAHFLRSPLAEFELKKKSKSAIPSFENLTIPDLKIEPIVQEIHLLKRICFEALELEFRLTRSAQALVNDYFDLAVIRAVDQFADCPANETLRNQLSLVVRVTKIGFYDWNILTDSIEFSEQMRADWQLESGCGLDVALARIHTEDRPRVNDLIERAMRDREDFKTDYRIVLPDGTEAWIEAQGTVTYDTSGNPVQFFGTSLNISERKKIEAALTAETLLLENIFRATPAGMALWSGPNFVFERVNPSFEAFFEGRSLKGKPVLEALPELTDQVFPKLIEQVYTTGEAYFGHEVLVKLIRKEGAPIADCYYDFAYVRIDGPDGKPYGVYDFSVEVTDRVLARQALEQVEHSLRKSIADLENERDLRERFVSALSHDLRTPLTSAKMAAQLLSRESGDRDRARSLAERIVAGVDRADRMIRDLLDANRIKAGEGIPMDIECAKIDSVAAGFAKEFEALPAGLLQIKNNISGAEVFWDESAIQRVLENLVGNAFKYGHKDTPVEVKFSGVEGAVEISVHNFGPIITEHDQATLFEPYRRTASAESGMQKGWGIGLSLVKGITEAHLGVVRVESRAELGTTFTIRLPFDARKKVQHE